MKMFDVNISGAEPGTTHLGVSGGIYWSFIHNAGKPSNDWL